MPNSDEQRLEKASGPSRRLLTALIGFVLALLGLALAAGPATAQNAVGPQPAFSILTVGAHQAAGQEAIEVRGPPLRPHASATSVAADTGFNAGLDATKLNMTRTVESHIGEYAKDGTLARPYADSRLTIQNVMDSVKPTADPGGVPGALRWDAPGSMNGSNGTWELVVDPSTNTVLHFMFRGAH